MNNGLHPGATALCAVDVPGLLVRPNPLALHVVGTWAFECNLRLSRNLGAGFGSGHLNKHILQQLIFFTKLIQFGG